MLPYDTSMLSANPWNVSEKCLRPAATMVLQNFSCEWSALLLGSCIASNSCNVMLMVKLGLLERAESEVVIRA